MFIKFEKLKNTKAAKIIYKINIDKTARKYSVNTKKFSYKSHLIGLKKIINSRNSKIYLTKVNNKIIGLIKIKKNKNQTLISWNVKKNYRKKGYGKKMLSGFVNRFKSNYEAKIKNTNIPSIKICKFSGFTLKRKNKKYQFYVFKN